MLAIFEDEATVLFQGDSITDAGRNLEGTDEMGTGYAMMAAARFSALYPDKKVKFLNRGISGNRVKDLRGRWQKDCLDINPAWVSILIGINDCWRKYDSGDPTSVESFEEDYRYLLRKIKEETKAGIILCEPFVLPFPEDREKWREDLDPKIAAVRRLAREFHAYLVPFDGIFAAASARREPRFWARDGVHPSPAGHALMAEHWLKVVAG